MGAIRFIVVLAAVAFVAALVWLGAPLAQGGCGAE
jgi:hypothetical protein